MLSAFDASGDFTVDVLEQVPIEQTKLFLNQREDYYIDLLHPSLNSNPVPNTQALFLGDYLSKELSKPLSEKKHYRRNEEVIVFNLHLHREIDSDLLSYYSNDNQGAIKTALREYIANHPND